MRLLFFVPGFPKDDQDFITVPTLQMLVRDLTRKGAEVHIIAFEYPFHKRPYRWYDAYVWPCNGQNRRWLKFRTIWRAVRRAMLLHAEGRFDCMHSFWLTLPFRIGASFAAETDTPHFVTFMGQDVLDVPDSLKKLLPVPASNAIVLSDFHFDALRETSQIEAGHIIPWGVEENETPKTLPTERPIDLLGVGSLLEVKRWDRWLETFRLVADKHPDLRGEIIGTGPLQKKLEKQILTLGLQDQVRLVGYLPRPEVLARMRQSKVFLHCSDFESFGMVVVEALQNACRVVSFATGIALELEEHLAIGFEPADLAPLVSEALDKGPFSAPLTPLTARACGWRYWELYHSV